MSVHIVRSGSRVGAVAGFPDSSDLADLWLVHALAHLLDAYGVPDTNRHRLVELGIDRWIAEIPVPPEPTDEAARLDRLDASRLALEFAALAVEARLNRVLRSCEASEWQAVAHLVPAEKFRLAPLLLGKPGSPKHPVFCDVVAHLFRLREELVEAAGQPGAALEVSSSQFNPSHARAMVEAGAKVCCFLASLVDEEENVAAALVRDAAAALVRRADLLGVVVATRPLRADLAWDEIFDFPPELIGS